MADDDDNDDGVWIASLCQQCIISALRCLLQNVEFTNQRPPQVMELKDVNASLVGHKNSRQKIQQVCCQRDFNSNQAYSPFLCSDDDKTINKARSFARRVTLYALLAFMSS